MSGTAPATAGTRARRRLQAAVGVLGRVSLFADLDDADLRELAQQAVRVPFRARATLSDIDRHGAGLSIVSRGAAKVCTRDHENRHAILALLATGDYFGELCILDGEPGPVRVLGLRSGELLHFPESVFRALLGWRPQILPVLLADTATRVRRAQEAIRRLALEDVRGRVTDVLRQLAEEDGEPCADGVWIQRRPSQQLLAGLAGSTRETVSRVLKDLEECDHIACDGRRVLLRSEAWN